jgi:predicted homoserine dehydrogenase-like protein
MPTTTSFPSAGPFDQGETAAFPIVRAGLIGCGSFGSSILAQAECAPGFAVPAVSDRDPEAVRRVYRRAGVPDDAVAECESHEAAVAAMVAGKRVIVPDPLLLLGLPLHLVAEATGEPESGARHAELAIRSGLHVAMVTKEADAAVGPILRRNAQVAGVVYTAIDGDQHGLLIRMTAWAQEVGLEVLCGGKARDQEVVFDPTAGTISSGSRTQRLTPEEVEAFLPLTATTGRTAETWRRIEARRQRLGSWGRIGGWDLVELAIAANATGLAPDQGETVHCLPVYAGEIPELLCPEGQGGLLQRRGAVEAVTCLRFPHEVGLGGGVFMVVASPSERSREILRGGGVHSNREGSATLLTRPYHLLGVEAIHSMCAAVLRGETVSAGEYLPRFDVLARAARDLPAGTLLGTDHSPELEPFLAPAAALAGDRPLPVALGTGNRLVRHVSKGAVIPRGSVAAPSDSPLWALRAKQDAAFLR